MSKEEKVSWFFKILIFSGMAVILSLWLNLKDVSDQFSDDVNSASRIFNQRVTSLDSVLTSFATLLDVSEEMNETELISYTEKIIKAYPYINAIINMPHIGQKNVKEFEQSMRQKGFVNLKIKSLEATSNSNNTQYFPISSIEPMTPLHAKLLGLNLYSSKYYYSEIASAIRTGRTISSKIDNKLALSESEMLIFKALYSGRYVPINQASKIDSAIGVVALEINILEFMSFMKLHEFDLEVKFENITLKNASTEGRIYWTLDQLDYVHALSMFDHKYQLHLNRKLNLSFINLPRMAIIWLAVMVLMFFITFLLSKRKFAEQALVLSEKRFVRITQTAPIGIFQTDINGGCIFINEGYEKIARLKEKDALGTGWANYIHPDDKKKVFEGWALSVEKNERFEMDYRQIMPDKGFIWVHCQSVAEYNDDGEIISYLGTIQDITKQKESAAKIAYQAHFDSLTGLPNRFLSLDRLSRVLNDAERNSEKVALLFIDLDNFKKVNDSLGHEAGDSLLVEAASRLESVIRSNDTVGRLGGDEFVMVIGGLTDTLEVTSITEKVMEVFRQPYKIKNRDLFITTSIGIALYPEDGENASKLLANADLALYQAKDLGRNTFSFYTEKLNKENSRRLIVEQNLRSALANKELSVHYQPKINMSNGEIMGAEALLRWHSAKLGSIGPDEFIPIAEQIDLIQTIGEFVLKQALKDTAKWQTQFNPKFKIAINLSPKQFRDGQLFSLVDNALKNTHVSPNSIELEITEGVLLNKFEGIKQTLQRFSDLGVQIAMDDFGTGYSSLSYLRSYPFNVLKIDRAFVRDMFDDIRDCELVYATIAMSHGLSLKVVAEGVETEQQYQLLKDHKCDYAQGYLFSKPVTADEISALLKQNKTFNEPFSSKT